MILVFEGISLVAIIGISVFFRYVLDSALSWPGEVAGIIFVWYTLLGMVVLVGDKSHIAFDLFEKCRLPIISKLVAWLSQLTIVVYGIIMTVYGWQYVQMFPDETSPAAGINLTWLKSAVPITGILVIIYVLFNMLDGFLDIAQPNGLSETPSIEAAPTNRSFRIGSKKEGDAI